MNFARVALLACSALIFFVTGHTRAQDLRDPTLPPRLASLPLGAGASDVPWGDEAGTAVVLRNGKYFLVNGTRLYGVGETLGGYKIIRISETEIWLRSGKEVRKLARFAGIQRKPVAEIKGPKP